MAALDISKLGNGIENRGRTPKYYLGWSWATATSACIRVLDNDGVSERRYGH